MTNDVFVRRHLVVTFSLSLFFEFQEKERKILPENYQVKESKTKSPTKLILDLIELKKGIKRKGYKIQYPTQNGSHKMSDIILPFLLVSTKEN